MTTDRLTDALGDEVILRWQSAQVLRVLVQNLGAVVSRDDIITEVWDGVAVTDDSLTQCIKDIRRALDDHDHAILSTLRKRGYKLNGDAVPGTGASAAVAGGEALGTASSTIEARQPAQPVQPTQPVPLDANRADGVLARATNVDTPAAGGSTDPDASLLIRAELDPRDLMPTLAVLPMRPLNSDQPDAMGLLVADEIATALSRSEDVNIISQMSMARIGATDLSALKTMLRADFVLSGFLVSDGAHVILSLEFSETDSGFVLWSDRMRIPVTPLMQNLEVVDRVVANVRNAIMSHEVRRVRSYPVSDLKLFSVMHGAVGLMHRASRKDFDTARDHLEHVSQAVPRSPTPLAWLARWHVLRTTQGWTDDPAREARDALGYTARALDMDPECTLALVCEGQVLAHVARRLDEAEARYDLSLALSPNDAQGRALRGMLSTFRDRAEDGKRDTERALHLTPLDPHRFFYLVLASAANIATGDHDRAVTLARESLRRNPTHVSTLRTLAAAQAGAGALEEARKTTAELLRIQPDLRISTWLASTPGAEHEAGRMFAELLSAAGVPK